MKKLTPKQIYRINQLTKLCAKQAITREDFEYERYIESIYNHE